MFILFVQIVCAVSCVRLILSASSSSILPRRDGDQAEEGSKERSPKKQKRLPDLNFPPPPEEMNNNNDKTANLESMMHRQEESNQTNNPTKKYINKRRPKRMTPEEFAKHEKERKQAYRERKGANWRTEEGRRANQRTKERIRKVR